MGELQWSGLQACKWERETGSQMTLSLHFFFFFKIAFLLMISFNFHYGPMRERTGIYVSSEETHGEEETQQIKYLVKVGG